jgi:cytochrome P450
LLEGRFTYSHLESPSALRWVNAQRPQVDDSHLKEIESCIDEARSTGDRVRLAPNKLSFNIAEGWQDIYGYGANVTKAEDFYGAFRVNPRAFNTFNTTDVEMHRRKRRVMSRAFSPASIARYEGSVVHRLDELVNNFRADEARDPSTTFNMASIFQYLMLDAFGSICFGETFGFMAGKETDLVNQFHSRAMRVNMVGHASWLGKWGLDQILIPASRTATAAIGAHARKNAITRLKKYRSEATLGPMGAPNDILGTLIASIGVRKDSSYSDEELVGESMTILIAGFDTSSTCLSASLWYILSDPDIHDKLLAELKAHNMLGQGAISPSFDSLEKCEYLEAIVLESLRLAPPTPGAAPRVAASGGAVICNEYIPEGTWVSVPSWTIHRNAIYFDHPHDFTPERWLSDSGKPLQAQGAFQPFQVGPRHCIGKHLALKEVMLVLARLFVEFEMELAEGDGSGCPDGMIGGVGKGTRVFRQTDVYTSVEHGPVIGIKSRR